MKPYSIKYLNVFKKDLKNIIDYLSIDLGNGEAAHRLIGNIDNKINLISENPRMYQRLYFAQPLKHDYRYFVSGKYMVIYYVDDEEKMIVVQRIVYAKRNLKSLNFIM